MNEDDELVAEAGHDRSNPSGIPDEGLVHEHEGQVHFLQRKPQEVTEEHHEEGHFPDVVVGEDGPESVRFPA
jgi:hypothetical protein